MAFMLTGALVVMGALGLAIGAPLSSSSSSSSSSSPAFAMGGAGGDFVLNNGVVSAIGGRGEILLAHPGLPGAGAQPPYLQGRELGMQLLAALNNHRSCTSWCASLHHSVDVRDSASWCRRIPIILGQLVSTAVASGGIRRRGFSFGASAPQQALVLVAP